MAPRRLTILALSFAGIFGLANLVADDQALTDNPSIILSDAEIWADSMLNEMSLEEKVGQLFWIEMQSQPNDVRIAHIEKAALGGIILPAGDVYLQNEFTNFLQNISRIPLWTASTILELGKSNEQIPALLEIAAISEDSLLQLAGHAYLREANMRGINVAQLIHSENPAVGHAKSLLLESLQQTGKLSLLSSTHYQPATNSDFGKGILSQRDSLLFLNRQKLLSTGEDWVLGNEKEFPEEKVLGKNDVLVQKINFNENPDYTAIAQLHFNSGADAFLLEESSMHFLNTFKQAVKSGKISKKALDTKVRRLLLVKAELGLQCIDFQDPGAIAEIRSDPFGSALNKTLQANSITYLRNDHNFVPIGAFSETHIFAVSFGDLEITPFQQMLFEYANVIPFNISDLPSKASLRALKNEITDSVPNTVIIALHDLPLTNDGQLPEHFFWFLDTLNKTENLVVINFSEPEKLSGLGFLHSLVQVYNNDETHQILAAESIFGSIAPKGKLPIDVAGSFCQGDGLVSNKVSRIAFAEPEEVGIPEEALARIDSIIYDALFEGAFPGCQVAIAKDGKLIYEQSYGYHTYQRAQKVVNEDIYDLASITKVAATTMGMMLAYENNYIKLSGRLKDYIPGMDSANIRNVKLEEIMIHKSGLPEAIPVYYYFTATDSADSIRSKYFSMEADSVYSLQIAENMFFNENYMDTIMERIGNSKLYNYGNYAYSDLGFFLLSRVIAEVYQRPMDSVLNELLYEPLGLQTLCFKPSEKFPKERIIPTEKDRWFRGQQVHGYVHDPTAALFGGVSGHAGLFSNARDLAILMQVMLNDGKYGGKQYFSKNTIERFTQRHAECYRGLGFDKPPGTSSRNTYCSNSTSKKCFGHIGFTGTCVWTDPEYGLTYVFLSNRVYPKSNNYLINAMSIRQKIHQVIYDAMGVEAPIIEEQIPEEQQLLSKTDSLISDGS